VLTGCGNGGGNNTGPAATATPTPPHTASFSGTPPPPLASPASSAAASARASASKASASAAARASEFEASVSAESVRSAAVAQKELKGVHGQGNALPEVGMTGMPGSQTGGVLAVLVTITNKTGKKASYAAQVDFVDAAGRVVETRYVGAENLQPGQKKQPIAFSRQPPGSELTARLTKAQRY
jgi:hypothetical protein